MRDLAARVTTWPRTGDTALNARIRPSGLLLGQHFQRLLRVTPLRWERVGGQVRVGNAGRAFPAEFLGLPMPAWRFPEAPGAAGQASLRVKARARHRVVFAAVPGKTSIGVPGPIRSLPVAGPAVAVGVQSSDWPDGAPNPRTSRADTESGLHPQRKRKNYSQKRRQGIERTPKSLPFRSPRKGPPSP